MKTFRPLIFLAALTCAALTASAQSYPKMWKQVEQLSAKDLPKSALAQTQQIEAKALREGNDVQLLRALLMQRVYGGSLSADSAKIYTQHLEQGLQREQQPVMRCLWQSALAQCWLRTESDAENSRDSLQTRAKRAFETSLCCMDTLAAARTHDYLPLFKEEDGSRYYFAGDLLHVLFNAAEESGVWTTEERTEWLRRMEQFYHTRGMNDASVHFALRRLEAESGTQPIKGNIEDDVSYQALDSLTRCPADAARLEVYRRMSDLRNRQTGNEAQQLHNDSVLYARITEALNQLGRNKRTAALQNFLEQMTLPAARVEGLPETGQSGQPTTLKLSVRNVQTAELRVTRLFADRKDYEDCDKDKLAEFAARQKKNAERITVVFRPATPYEWIASDTAWTLPQETGVYYAELLAGGKRLDAATFSVTNLTAVTFSAAGKNRVTAVDAKTGMPVAGAIVTAYRQNGNDGHTWQQVRRVTTDEYGTAEMTTDPREYLRYAVTTAADKASPWFTLYNVRTFTGGDAAAHTQIQVYTDRAIYRPGQKVQFTATVFTRQGDDCRTESGYEAQALLRDVNYKIVDSLLVRTDEFGSVHGELSLPKECLTGTFSLTIASKSQRGTRSIKVEEYKRPTFTTETQPLTSQYALGDTVQVEGLAQTYAGVPVGNASVQYEVRRSAWFYANGNGQESQTGELTTGDDGTFRIPVILKGESSDGDNMFPVRYNRYTYEVTYTVTAENGETAQGSTAVCVATKPYYLKVTLPDVVYLYKGKALPQFKVEKLNAQGQNLTGTGQYKVQRGKTIVAEGEFRTGTAFQFPELSTLSAGRYQFHFCTTAEDADSASFLIVREGDALPADTASPWFFHQENNAAADTARIVFGTNGKQEAVVFCDLVTASGKTESKRIVLRNEWRHLTLAYDTTFGDGATLYLATVRDGCLYTATATVKRPIPEKRLRLIWTSFRSRLTPGSKEEWSVRATHADGTPARAQMAACLYDASLDAFARNVWEDFHLYFPRRLPDAQWRGNEYGSFRQLTGQYGARYRTEPVCRFSHWQEGLFGDYRYAFFPHRRMLARAGGMVFAEVASLNVQQDRALLGNTNAIKITREKNNTADTETDGQVTVRKDFNETAYFAPALVTNEVGEVTMRFTLPESVTTWNFTALAHDAAMNFGRLDTTAVARKEFMVESALPRFLRSGDKAELPVKVTNLSEKSLSATVTVTLTNAADGKAVYKCIRCVDVPAGKTTTCPFSYDTAEFEGLLVCRVEGNAANFGDGEERYLPVLTDKEIVMRALPFSLTEKGNTLLRVDTLLRGDEKEHPALHVEVTSNPVWYALNSLPVLLNGNSCLSATEWATRLYALGLGNYVAQSNPEIRKAVENNSDELEANADILSQGLTDVTPWLREGMEERERAKALRELFDESSAKAKLHTAVDKLGNMQDGEGAYAWFPGMKGNRWVTLEVATLLAQMEHLTGNTAAHEQLARAMAYLGKDIHQSVAAMKKNGNKRQPDEFQLRYLSLYTLAEGQKENDDVKYLLRRAEELNKELTLYGKALTALVMARMGRNEEADELIQSLLEYTVVSKEMGRCFDTPRTRTLTSTSKILVQCAAAEVLPLTGHAAESEEMRLWLMQSRRTQTWRTSQATADAVYTLLQAEADGRQLVQPLSQTEPVYFTLLDGKGRIVGFNAKSESRTPSTSGYFKQTYEGNEALQTKNVRISKRTDGLAWGCVYATYVAKAADAPAEGTGISMRSTYEVKRGAEWQPVDNKSLLQKGDCVRRVFTLTADRDYDFVRLCATRPACLEPVHPLSGYDWASGLPAYRAVKDAETQFFIERLSKGTHRIAEEFFTDKAGTFSTGLSNAECVNVPEYCAAVPAATLQVAE